MAWASCSTARALKIDAFFCKYALNDLRGLYYDLNWEKHRKEALSVAPDGDTAGLSWRVSVKEAVGPRKVEKKKSSKRLMQDDEMAEDKSLGEESDYSPAEDDDESEDSNEEENDIKSDNSESEDELALSTTPTKRKRKVDTAGLITPQKRKRRKTLAVPTPHSKRALKSRRARKAQPSNMLASLQTLEFTCDSSLLENLPKDPWLRAMQILHVAARPDALPCREEEFVKILKAVESLLEEGSGGCICG